MERQKIEQIDLEAGEVLKNGDKFTVTDEDGTFTFRSVTVFIEDGVTTEKWIDAYGGKPSHEKSRAFHPGRVEVTRPLGPRGGDRTIGVAGYERLSVLPPTPVWDPTPEEIAAGRKVKAERKAKRRAETGGLLRVFVENDTLPAGTVLTHGDGSCVVLPNGCVELDGEEYSSLSAAGRALTGHKGCQGWKFWMLPNGLPIDTIRN